MYIYFDIISFEHYDVGSSDLEFCGTIRFGIYSFPTLGATLPRMEVPKVQCGSYGMRCKCIGPASLDARGRAPGPIGLAGR